MSHAGIDREKSRIPVRLARCDKIGGTERHVGVASRGRERAPSGQSSCLEVRFQASGVLRCQASRSWSDASRMALRAYATRETWRGNGERETDATHDGEQVRRCSSSPEPSARKDPRKTARKPNHADYATGVGVILRLLRAERGFS